MPGSSLSPDLLGIVILHFHGEISIHMIYIYNGYKNLNYEVGDHPLLYGI